MTDLTPEQQSAISQTQKDCAKGVERARADYARSLSEAAEDRVRALMRIGVDPSLLPAPGMTLEDAAARAPDIRVVTMQQFVLDADVTNMTLGFGLGDEGLERLMQQERENAEAELAQAYADGYEIADVTVSVGERVIATVWTLKAAEKVVVRPLNIDFGAYGLPPSGRIEEDDPRNVDAKSFQYDPDGDDERIEIENVTHHPDVMDAMQRQIDKERKAREANDGSEHE